MFTLVLLSLRLNQRKTPSRTVSAEKFRTAAGWVSKSCFALVHLIGEGGAMVSPSERGPFNERKTWVFDFLSEAHS